MLGGPSPLIITLFNIGPDSGFVKDEKLQGLKKSNKKPTLLAADFSTEEMFSFQDRSDATEAPNMNSLPHIFRVFEPKRMSEKILLLIFVHLKILPLHFKMGGRIERSV